MAVLAMKRINIYALKANRKKILELMQFKGTVEIKSFEEADSLFKKTDTTSARSTFEKNALNVQSAVEILDKLAPHDKSLFSMFSGRKVLSKTKFGDVVANATGMTKIAMEILSLDKNITENKADILRYQTQIDMLNPWAGLDVSMRTNKTKKTRVFIGTLPGQIDELAIKSELAEYFPDTDLLHVEIISSNQQQTCFFVIVHNQFASKIESALKSIGMVIPSTLSKIPPKERISVLEERICQKQLEIEALEKQIISYKDKREELLYTSDFFSARAEKYRVLGDLWQSEHIFIISGYIPEKKIPEIQSVLENNHGAHVETEDTDDNEEVPVLLSNNGYSSPVEGVVENYSMPGREEVDPSSVMAIFYYVLFGLMLSDAAYGALITIACAVLLNKCKTMETGLNKALKMFMYSGISTVFWGIMFGSYFGDLIPTIASTFFNTEIIISPLWFAPLDDPLKMLLFSFIIGVIHLFTGLAVNLYQLVKGKKYLDAIYDVVFWYFLVGGLITVLVSSSMFRDMFSLNFTLPSVVSTIAAIISGVGAVGIIATAGRSSKSPVKRILKGLYGLYDISGYLSDILSYSRLLALGLATGVIASVFNQIGSMFGGGVVGAIVFIIVFIIGHTLNIGINALGAYVHTNRLQYVEFFGKFYSGGSRRFNPFTTNTKYIKVTEEK